LVAAPLLVAQGDADPLVLAAMQRRWVAARCAAGQRLDSPLTPALVAWAQARLAGDPAPTTC
jgi:hypothetical protein